MLVEFTDQSFDSKVTSNVLTIVDFWSAWCKPCNMLSPIIKSLAEHNGDVIVGKLNVAENPNIARRFNISAIPTIIFLKNDKVIKTVVGLHTEKQLQEIIDGLK